MVQETLNAALQARAGYSGRASEKTWLIGILKHKIVDFIRRQVRETTVEDISALSDAVTENPLDDIPGIGPSRKKALLAHFGSAKAVRNAALADLEAVDGVSKAMAKRIHDWFQR